MTQRESSWVWAFKAMPMLLVGVLIACLVVITIALIWPFLLAGLVIYLLLVAMHAVPYYWERWCKGPIKSEIPSPAADAEKPTP